MLKTNVKKARENVRAFNSILKCKQAGAGAANIPTETGNNGRAEK